MHDPLTLAKHDHMVDNLGVWLPIFWQIERLPCEVIQFLVLHTIKPKTERRNEHQLNCLTYSEQQNLPMSYSHGVDVQVGPGTAKTALVADVH